MCLLAAFSILLPNELSPHILNGIPFVLDIFAFRFSSLTSNCVKNASELRKYYDSYVLNMKLDRYSDTEIREIREKAQLIYSKNTNKANIQMKNTDKESPPGVRNWYDCSKYYDGIDSQFECQKQNIWWNFKMIKIRFVIINIILIFVGLVFVWYLTRNDALNSLLCFSGILVKLIERVKEHCKYICVSYQINGAQLVVEAHPTKEGIEKLQELIDRRRSIVVLELGLVHKKYAKKLSTLYKNIAS